MNSKPDTNNNSNQNTGFYKRQLSMGMMFSTVIILGVYLSRPLYDPDFFWHLKTGQWIWENGTLPHVDPFGIPPFPEPSGRTDFILTSYWLIQLIMYVLFLLFGMSGIIFFRWVVVAISIIICAGWTNVRNSSVIAVIAIGVILILEQYFIERPQFISFVCFGALLVSLLRFCEQSASRSLWSLLVPLSIIMLIWSNMHGGFLIGQAILIYFVIAEGVKFLNPKMLPLSAQNYRILLISSLTALIASFVNPNAINLIKYLPIIFDANNYANLNVMEEMSVLENYKVNKYGVFLIYIGAMALTAFALFFSRQRKNITLVGILIGTAFMGWQHMRLMPFFVVSATVFMTKFFETECTALKGKIILMLTFVLATVYCISDEMTHLNQSIKSGWVPVGHFPVKAADSISINKIKGNIYTTMYWGGYMLWRTGSDNKIFCDGRTLNIQRIWEYNNSLIVRKNQRSYWKGLFNMYDVQVAVLPIYAFDGSPNMLTQSISKDTEWKMIFADASEVVFVRNGSEHQSILK